MPFRLAVGNKAYSSWSLRPWILLAHFKIPFEEVVIPLDESSTKKAILKYGPAGKVPVLQDGDTTVWESLAILEYVADALPEKPIWPKRRAARAVARSLGSEMHAGFPALRSHCPMNFRRTPALRELTDEVAIEVKRIEAAWAGARRQFGKAGPFLFGKFCAADAMFAPVVNRFHVYKVGVKRETRAYMEAVMELPAWRAWEKDAHDEPWVIEKYETLQEPLR